jgi:hypothetical protein
MDTWTRNADQSKEEEEEGQGKRGAMRTMPQLFLRLYRVGRVRIGGHGDDGLFIEVPRQPAAHEWPVFLDDRAWPNATAGGRIMRG